MTVSRMNRLVRFIFETFDSAIFATSDLINFEPRAQVRYGLVKRAMEEGDLIQIKRGLYTLAPTLRRQPLNLFGLANRMYYPSYVSLLSALSKHGWIPERIVSLTCVTSKNTAEFETPLGHFTFARVPQRQFFCGVEVASEGSQTWLQAKPLKALADYVYVHHLKWNSLEPLVESLRIEEEDLSRLTSQDFDELEGNYPTANHVVEFLQGLRKDLNR